MNGEQITGLILIIFGAYTAIRFRYNGKTALRGRREIANLLLFGKFGKESSKFDITFAQLMYLIVGIIFIIVGISKLFG